MSSANATDLQLADELSEIGDLGQGTLASLVIRKKGVLRGVQGAKVAYDNDKVHVLVWTGFHYKALVGRAYNRLHAIWDQGTLFQSLLTAVRQAGRTDVTLQDVSEAVQETNDSLLKVINGVGCTAEDIVDQVFPDPEAESTVDGHAAVWEPLVVDGQEVKGAKVYVGAGGTGPNAPVKGTIYLDGVKLGEKVLEEALHWKPNQKAKTVAKDILRSWLPNGLYVRYCLAPEALVELKVGKAASAAAKAAALPIEPEAIRSLFKIAP
jgi:hypothetical protein